MAQPVLDGRQRRHLRALAHHHKALVQLGARGLTPGVVGAVHSALETHELVKVRVLADAAADLVTLAEELARSTESALAQTLGHTLLFYRPHPETPRIRLPAQRTRARAAEEST